MWEWTKSLSSYSLPLCPYIYPWKIIKNMCDDHFMYHDFINLLTLFLFMHRSWCCLDFLWSKVEAESKGTLSMSVDGKRQSLTFDIHFVKEDRNFHALWEDLFKCLSLATIIKKTFFCFNFYLNRNSS